MLKFRENRREHLPGFSAAEMLLVLLIISFLILAMPPLVHKKVEKRISRGEHGRYECWLDPDDPNGETLREFYATEKGGYTKTDTSAKNYTETVTDADGKEHPIGHVVDRCEFNPVEDAPNAAYFAFQATGGGGSGSYAPYDSNDTDYKGESSQSATVKLNVNSSGTVQGACSTSYGVGTCNYSYANSLSSLASTAGSEDSEDDSWVLDFFTPVYSGSDIIICSSAGYYGQGNCTVNSIADDGGSGGSTSWDYGTPNPVDVYYTVTVSCGCSGGNGICAKKAKEDIWLNESNTITLTGLQYSGACNPSPYCVANSSKIYCGNVSSRYDSRPKLSSEHTQISSPSYCSDNTSAVVYDETGADKGCSLEQGETGSDHTQGLPSLHDDDRCRGANSKLSDDCTNNGWESYTTTSRYQLPSFNNLTYKRNLYYNSPSYGYAGDAGESVSMILNKLDSELEFEIGKGGKRASLSDTAGESGQPTIVKTRVNGTTQTIMTARGGLTISGGVIGSKIFLRGKYTCSTSSYSEDSGTYAFNEYEGVERTNVNGGQYISYIDGCLDAGVATYGEAKKRFSVSSGFYTLPELDDDSNTPSAIDEFYAAKYRMTSEDGSIISYMPGSGGNGGYSFIANIDGEESVSVSGHNNFNADLINNKLNTSLWADNGSYNIVIDYSSDSHDLGDSKQFYRCYNNVTDQRYAAESSDGGGSGTADDIDWYPNFDNAEVGFCKPGTGWPGAVIIVW